MSSQWGRGPRTRRGKDAGSDTAEPEEITRDECLGNKDDEGVVKERTPEESDLAHRSEVRKRGSNMAVDRGGLVRDKQMTSNLGASKRGEPEKSEKSKRSSTGAMTLKVEDPPPVRITPE
ncbi:hypothetical protein RND71_036884 [Anisodus tanguticus]|uniref:Uncharacterized protein n=1 Tax=Anisodus tanguticus TaxID=243964 RepID=A0AAE1R1U2_9SOLA|nr:hypothetical protein RND71_036884 [Anisodus tanguticus]